MKHLLLALGLLAFSIPAQERQRQPRREGPPPAEIRERLQQAEQRLEQLRERLQERREQLRQSERAGAPGRRGNERGDGPGMQGRKGQGKQAQGERQGRRGAGQRPGERPRRDRDGQRPGPDRRQVAGPGPGGHGGAAALPMRARLLQHLRIHRLLHEIDAGVGRPAAGPQGRPGRLPAAGIRRGPQRGRTDV